MKYTQTLWNSQTLDYNVFSYNRYGKAFSRIILPIILPLWFGMCCSLLVMAVPFDCLTILRVKQLKNNKRTKQYVLQRYYEKI
jgi:hypothetical protein